MKKALAPLNLRLMNPTLEQLQRAQPVTSLDTTDGPGGNFHEDGLFSTRIFGRVGDPARDKTFGYIDMRLPVFHPIIFRIISKMRSFYAQVLAGLEYATFDESKGEFVKSNEIEGRTGYAFFVQHWPRLKFTKGDSAIRNVQIDLIEKYRHDCLVRNLLVMPAGLRDAEIDTDGRMTVGEINEFYQGVLMLVRNFPETINKNDDLSIYDRTRYACMLRFCEIYDYVENLISGKNGFIQSRFASRRTFNGTRNVLSSLDTSAVDLDAPNRPKFNDAVVGLYQAAHASLPRVIYQIRTGIVGDIFQTSSNQVELVNKQTLLREWVEISNEDMDKWSTEEGLESVVGELEVIEKRNRPVEIAGHYLALIYVDDKDSFKIIRNIDEVPEGFDRKWVRPLTYAEMIYIAALPIWNQMAAFVTRYPVENFNSSSANSQYVKTTVQGKLRYGLDHNWQKDESQVALEYPVFQLGVPAQWHDAMSISPSRLAAKGADFDGDTGSYLAVYSKEAMTEARRYFKRRRAYVEAGRGLAFGTDIHTVNLTLAFITGNPNQ